MKRTPMLLIGALLLVAGSAYAKDWSTIRFGVDASYGVSSFSVQ